jgi:hypothetical protein
VLYQSRFGVRPTPSAAPKPFSVIVKTEVWTAALVLVMTEPLMVVVITVMPVPNNLVWVRVGGLVVLNQL